MSAPVPPPPADTAAPCCDCICDHQCTKDPTVIGHQGCVACKWCSCADHPAAPESPRTAVSPPPADDGTFGLRTAFGDDEIARLIRRQRETARKYFQMDAVARQTAWLVANGYEEASDA